MKDQEFFTRVADRSGLTWRESVDVSRATLLALADRISGDEARELAAHLPARLAEPLRTADEPVKQYDLVEFARRVRRHAGLTPRETASGVTAVLTTLRDAAPDAADRAISELPRAFPTA
jgi:uncharacterized protein (DUF2267 family)